MRQLLAGTLLVIAFAVAGCGGGSSSPSANSSSNGEASKSAQQVLTDAAKAAAAANTMHMSGQITSNGRPIGVDMTIVKGKGAKGTITLDGHTVDLVVIGTDAYMKADADFYSQFAGSSLGSTAGQLLAGHWLKFSTTNPEFGGFTAFANSQALFKSMTSNHGNLTNKGEKTYKGQSAVDLFDGAKNGSLYVAANGTAYPIALVKSGGSSPGTISFGDWNNAASLTAPSGAIDLSKLAG
jgi:hypothetical protein